MSGSPSQSPVTKQRWQADIAGAVVELPIVAIKPDLGIALMITIDLGVGYLAHVGSALARRLAPLDPEVIVGTATMGIPLAIEVSRSLGLDDYVILQKSPKIHLADALVQSIVSITSKGEQRLLLDRRSIPSVAGKRTVIVDDVVATGSSLKGSIALARAAGADVVGVGVILTESHEWRETLGDDAGLVTGLGHIPQFRPDAQGVWQVIPGTTARA